MVIQTIERLAKHDSIRYSFDRVEEFSGSVAIQDLADTLRISTDVIRRYKRDGLTFDEGDRVACRLFVHPVSIWSAWIDIPPVSGPLLDAVEEFQVTHKLCQTCEQWKSREEEFHKRAASTDGRARNCRGCSRLYEENRKDRREEHAHV